MDVPAYVTGIMVATTLAVVLAATVVLRSARVRSAGRARVYVPVGVTLFAWLVTTAALAAAGLYWPTPTGVPAVPVAFIIGLSGAWAATMLLPPLRALIDASAIQPSLIALQVWRVVGVVFLMLLWRGQLPPLFALPAGLGDIAAGLAAPFVARRLQRPGGTPFAVAWNVFGLLDLIVAIGLGATTNVGPVQIFYTDPSSAVMTAFPMALVPTFLVPLSMMLHFLSLRYLLRARTTSAGAVVAPGEHLDPGR
jgi:hypothetical protein